VTAVPSAAPSGTVRFQTDDFAFELAHNLLLKGHLSATQLSEAQNRASIAGIPLDQLLLKERLVEEKTYLAEAAAISGIPFHDIGDFRIEKSAADRVPAKLALRYGIMPLSDHAGVLTLAASRVPNLTTVDGLRMVLDAPIEWVLCTETDIRMSLTHFYGLGADTIDQLIAEAEENDTNEDAKDIAVRTEETGMVRFINMIIAEAIRMDTTDIHIEPFDNSLRLRYRIDGILQEIPLPKGIERLRRSISSAVKIMANMDISERRKPHDGRIKVRYNDNDFDLRVSVLPSAHGETCCLRILNRSSTSVDLDNLGISKNQLPKIERLTDLPHGVILLTGPTGSGKTTTLYAILARLNKTGVKIITVEDPIEYQMFGINQIQVHSKIGLTFASALRSILRHDPDVILIGEIRDSETADIAVRSSLTGHLVLSTLHTNDAPSAVPRLIDMGVEPYLIASCVEGIIAQRLVRRICPHCRDSITPPEPLIREMAGLYPDLIGQATFYLSHGCPNCSFTGYRGRTALTEAMVMTNPLRALVISRQPANIIKDLALQEGMVTLRQDGWLRVIEGRTSVDEVMRVAGRME
jgi:type II secretory ATPase GspE/PulE/Tfp pilus assembly ATPase PilB-like protein